MPAGENGKPANAERGSKAISVAINTLQPSLSVYVIGPREVITRMSAMKSMSAYGSTELRLENEYPSMYIIMSPKLSICTTNRERASSDLFSGRVKRKSLSDFSTAIPPLSTGNMRKKVINAGP